MIDQDAPWLPATAVRDQLPGVALDGDGNLPADVELHRLAAADFVEDERRDLVIPAVPAVLDVDGVTVLEPAVPASFGATPRIVLGAAMLVSRLKARQGSPQGLVGFGEFGPATVMREDPDVARMLGIGRFGKPVAR